MSFIRATVQRVCATEKGFPASMGGIDLIFEFIALAFIPARMASGGRARYRLTGEGPPQYRRPTTPVGISIASRATLKSGTTPACNSIFMPRDRCPSADAGSCGLAWKICGLYEGVCVPQSGVRNRMIGWAIRMHSATIMRYNIRGRS